MNASIIGEGLGLIVAAIITVIGTWVIQSRVEERRARRELLRKQLAEFYDPLLVLLTLNGRIFNTLGPFSRRTEEPAKDEEKRRVWNSMLDNVIDKNNQRILEIIQTKLHLVSTEDSIDKYVEFSTHVVVYREFRQRAFEDYGNNFRFPSGFRENVEFHHKRLRSLL